MRDSGLILVFVILLAPAVIFLASSVERRLGAAAAGWTAALPVAFAVAVLAVRLDAGNRAAAAMALSAASHVPAQIAFAASFAVALRHRRLPASALAATAGYTAASLLLAMIPPDARLAAAIIALRIGPTLITQPPAPLSTTPRGSNGDTTLSCLAAGLIVTATTLTSRIAGPVAAGTIAAFPTMSATLAISIALRSRQPAAINALQGLTRSLPCYLTFALVIALTAPTLPLLASGAIALVACTATGRLTWRTLPRPIPAGADR